MVPVSNKNKENTNGNIEIISSCVLGLRKGILYACFVVPLGRIWKNGISHF